MTKKINAAKVYTNGQVKNNQEITVSEGKIVAIKAAENDAIFDYANLAPGLFDTHINGGERLYFTQNPNEECIRDIVESSQKCGTGYVLPALITSSAENIFKGIEAIKSYMARYPDSGLAGMHLEGPFLNVKKRGAHLEKYIQKPANDFIEEIIRHGKDVIRIITIAPENFTDEQVKMLLDSGINVSAGHSNATLKEAQHGFDLGIKLVTHLYNAMSAFTHREPGLIGASLSAQDVYAPIILDGVHCDFEAARIAYKCKKDKLFLISDALFVNKKVQSFKWEEFDAYLGDNQYRNTDGNLAGATISLADGVVNAVRELGVSISEAIEMATLRPAQALKMDHLMGKVEAGYPAQFTVFNDDLSEFKYIN